MRGDEILYFVVHCRINKIFCGDENNAKQMVYLACKQCKKKVVDEASGYRCERCMKTFPDAVPTLNFALSVSDFTDSHIFKAMGEVGEPILNKLATEFYDIHDD